MKSLALVSALLVGCVSVDQPNLPEWSTCVPEQPQGPEKPMLPYPRTEDYPWMSRNEWCHRVQNIRCDPARSTAQVGFIGDSITQMWPKEEWNEFLVPHHPLRMGIGGDRTQNSLWRIDKGELNGLKLKTMVLLIGTNNLDAGDSPEDVTQGIQHIIMRIRQAQPQIRIILMAIFPRGASPEDPLRDRIKATNALLAASARDWQVEMLDIGSQLLEKDGTISREMMGDFVHLTHKGYRIWGQALAPFL